MDVILTETLAPNTNPRKRHYNISHIAWLTNELWGEQIWNTTAMNALHLRECQNDKCENVEDFCLRFNPAGHKLFCQNKCFSHKSIITAAIYALEFTYMSWEATYSVIFQTYASQGSLLWLDLVVVSPVWLKSWCQVWLVLQQMIRTLMQNELQSQPVSCTATTWPMKELL